MWAVYTEHQIKKFKRSKNGCKVCFLTKVTRLFLFFNIDLLNHNKHKPTDKFIDTMYSISLFTKITRPSRITSHSTTLIDNIFTNDIDNNTVSGLLINYISDHLPVFTICDCTFRNDLDNQMEYRRIRTEEAMNTLK